MTSADASALELEALGAAEGEGAAHLHIAEAPAAGGRVRQGIREELHVWDKAVRGKKPSEFARHRDRQRSRRSGSHSHQACGRRAFGDTT